MLTKSTLKIHVACFLINKPTFISPTNLTISQQNFTNQLSLFLPAHAG
ncbi:MAG: hypothetical protein ACI9V1_001370 [Spirosomataceae bacterium]|jgi:hypothetical protein